MITQSMQNFICLFFMLIFIQCGQYSSNDIIGTYINNYEEASKRNLYIPHEAPNTLDTLTLYGDGRFKSIFFGEGTYELGELNDNVTISLSYEEKISLEVSEKLKSSGADMSHFKTGQKSGYTMNVSNKGLLGGTPTLEINPDGDYYYKKIK